MKIMGLGQESKTSLDKHKTAISKSMTELQSGDKFKASILDIKRNEITIKLSDGNVITAKSLIIPEAHIGDTMEFTVQSNKEGQILLSMFSKEDGGQPNTLLNILSAANIMPSDEAVAIIKILLDNGMPVDKGTIQNLVQTFKANSNLDMETLAFMLKEDIPITAKNIEQTNLTSHSENQIKNQIDILAFKLAGIDESHIKEQIVSIFLPEANEIQNITQNLETAEQKAIFKDISSFIAENSATLSETLDISKNEDINQILETLSNKYPDKAKDFDMIKGDDKLVMALKELLNSKELLNFEYLDKELKPEVLGKAIRESLFINIKKYNTPEDLNNYYQQLNDKLTKAILVAEKGITENTREAVKILTEMKDNIEFMNNINKFQEFIQIPFKLGDTNNQGDLYVFSDKKGKKLSKDRASVLLALDLSMLGHFEAFVQKDFKNISCQFRTMDKKVQTIVQLNISKLQSALKQHGYNLSQVMYKTIEEPFNILKNPEEAVFETEQDLNPNKRYSFDMRA